MLVNWFLLPSSCCAYVCYKIMLLNLFFLCQIEKRMSEYVTSSVFEKQYLIICERKSSIHLYDLGIHHQILKTTMASLKYSVS